MGGHALAGTATVCSAAMVGHWLEMTWMPAAVLRLDSGITPTGRPRQEGVSGFVAHILTPETETTTHCFWAHARQDRRQGLDLSERIGQALRSAFETEDQPMAEARQEMMGTPDFWSLRPTCPRSVCLTGPGVVAGIDAPVMLISRPEAFASEQALTSKTVTGQPPIRWLAELRRDPNYAGTVGPIDLYKADLSTGSARLVSARLLELVRLGVDQRGNFVTVEFDEGPGRRGALVINVAFAAQWLEEGGWIELRFGQSASRPTSP